MRTNLLLAVPLLLFIGCTAPRPAKSTLPETGSLPPRPTTPDVLVSMDGDRIQTQKEWERERRPELKRLFADYMYGPIPAAPAGLRPQLTGEYRDFLGGKATLKLVSLVCGNESDAPKIDLMLLIPNARRQPAPTFLVMNFCGNHTVNQDPRVPLTRSWLYDNCGGVSNHFATEAARGTQSTNWPLEAIVDRGYAVATFCSADIDADRGDASTGIYKWLAKGDPAVNSARDRGTIAAWAWGFQRCVDYLVRDRAIDERRIASVGHSRNGKTSLLAAAYDERISMAFAHQAGCGGTAPSRGKVGESVKAINDRFPHWFNAKFKEFNETPEKLPFDQHCLMALCAPRPVLVSAATEDQWSNPAGQFDMTVAASPAYRLFGVDGVRAQSMPAPGQMVGRGLGFYLREGRHSMNADDWRAFMDFADQEWGKPAGPR